METESDFLVEESLLLYIILVLFMPWARWLLCNLSNAGLCGRSGTGDSLSAGTVIILQCYIFIVMLILPLSGGQVGKTWGSSKWCCSDFGEH